MNRFKKKRDNNNEVAEDYTEKIYDLILEKEVAKVKDLADFFGVTHVTVIKTIKRLEDKGLVIKENRKQILLTKKGTKIAIESKRRHETIVNFLLKLGVSRKTAELDAEGIEHHISLETLEKISQIK